jgi:deoxyribodipyrimidine photolyase-related protein
MTPTPAAVRVVLGDQLSLDIASLRGLDPATDIVLMMEVVEEAVAARRHKQKIVLVLAAMRHFAASLRAKGITVDYVTLDDPDNAGSFTGEIARAVSRHRPSLVIATEPGAWRVKQAMDSWETLLGVPVVIRADDRFFCSRERFAAWAEDRRSLRMEFFYRAMRRETGLLMDDGGPVGGDWNYDSENRKPWPKGATPPERKRFEPDSVTRAVIALVGERFEAHFGDLEPFGWAVTRADALTALDHFIADCLPGFGEAQDAMKTGAPFLNHAVLSPYLNIGLLNPREICDRAEQTWRSGKAPLNAVEGFIRQILGWREYVRGVYWHLMPGYARTNALGAHRDLPWLYWSGETAMNCMAQVIGETRRHAYAHHIQRLMVTGNFALLAGIAPRQIEEWYLIVYADAFEWVELPNVHGMVMYADGGVLASKPYAASGAYIDRMSDYCAACEYDPKVKSGPGACPFNFLYWNFLIENEKRLGGNPRMAMPYRNLARFTPDRRAEIVRAAKAFLDGLPTGPDAKED